VVLDRTGTLLEFNGAAERILGTLELRKGPPAVRCCDLFGCGSPGVLEGVCLTELASWAPTPFPEIRVDLPAGPPATAAWITVAGLDEGRWVVEVRPAEPGDRRRRTELHWISEPRLRIHALGRTRVESREGDIAGTWLEQRAGQLLKYLVCERRRIVAPDEIAEAIWPGSDQSILSSVRYVVHQLRRELEPKRPGHGPSSFISNSRSGYRLEPGVLWVDADEFEDRVSSGLAALSNGREERGEQLLEQAIDLYRGDFLADEPYASWAMAERDRLRLLAERSLRELLKRRGQPESALPHLRRLGELQPYDIEVQRELMAACLACGRRTEALRRYSELRNTLRREFGEELGFGLSDLAPGEPSPEGAASRPAG
jgi:DNA-binding SARP family transcriptional activator